MLCRQLAVLLNAGLNISEALGALAASTRQPLTQRALQELLVHIERGLPFSQSLALQPQHFPAIFVAVIAGAEQTSQLGEACARYADFLEHESAVRSRLKTALVYPTFLLMLGTAVVAFLMLYVVPKFSAIYSSIQGQLPWAARMLLRWGETLASAPLTVLAAVMSVAAVLVWVSLKGWMGVAARHLVVRVPQWQALARALVLARLYRTLGMLTSGGVPVAQSVQIVRQQLAEPWKSALDRTSSALERGHGLSEALAISALLTPVAHNLIAIGERSGALSHMLHESARFLELENSVALERMVRLIEPLIMTVVGGAIGGIVILMYMPIFEIAGAIR
jgi:general secretion pathway protein F